jgi:hypothetical protein
VWAASLTAFACSPDGTKKAYVRLTPDHDALDVANKVRMHQICAVREHYTDSFCDRSASSRLSSVAVCRHFASVHVHAPVCISLRA